MRTHHPVWRRSFVALVLSAGLGAACTLTSSEDDGWYMEPSAVAVADDQNVDDLVLELVDSLGAGVLDDGRGPVATSRAGLVAVGEFADCRVSVFDVVTHRLVYQFGGCGGGPSEFRAIGEIMFRGDSLYVFDQGRRDFAVLSPAGELVRRFVVMAMVTDSVSHIFSFSPVQDTLFGVPNSRPSRDTSIGLLLRIDDGAVVRRFGHPQPKVQADPTMVGFFPQMCSMNHLNGSLLIAVNPYRPETVAYAVGGDVAWRATPRIDWLSPATHERQTWPSAVVRAPICNDNSAMLRTINANPWAPRGTSFGSGVIEIRTHEGRLIFASEVDSVQSEIFSKGAAWEDYWLFNDPWSESPQLRLFRLRPRATEDEPQIQLSVSRDVATEGQ